MNANAGVNQLVLMEKKCVPFRWRRLRAGPCLYTLETNYYFGPARDTSFGETPLKQLTPDSLTSVSFLYIMTSVNKIPKENLMLDPFEENSHCETLTSQAYLTARDVAIALSIPDSKLVVIASILESMACLLPRKAPASFVSAFVKLLVAHIADNKLFEGLVKRFREGVPPEWNLLLRGERLSSIGAISSVWNHCAGQPELTLNENLAFIACFVESLPEILQAVGLVPRKDVEELNTDLLAISISSRYAKESKAGSTVNLTKLAQLVLRDDIGDVGTLCILQSARATGEVLTVAGKANDLPENKAAKRILAHIVERPHLVYLALRGLAPGALTIIEKHYQAQSVSFDLAIDDPPFFISSLLCHGVKFNLSSFPVLYKCVELAAERIEALAFHNITGLYKLHNSKARSMSLLATLCDAIYLVGRNIGIQFGEMFDQVPLFQNIFNYSTLPPYPKLNSYLPASSNMSAAAPDFEHLGPVLMLGSLVSSLGCLVRAASIVATYEIREVTKQEGLASSVDDKLTTYRVEKVIASIIAAMVALDSTDGLPLNDLIKRDCIESLNKLLLFCRKHTTEEVHLEGNVFWVTLFNMANDVCYSDIALSPVILQTLDMLVEKVELGDCEDLVKSALVPLYATFDDGKVSYPSTNSIIEWDIEGCQLVSVPRGEYEFLNAEKAGASIKSPGGGSVIKKSSEPSKKK